MANGTEIAADYNGYFVNIPAAALKSGANQILVEYSHCYDKDGNGLHRFTYPEVESTSVLRKRVKYRGFLELRRRSCVSAVVPGIL